MTEESDPLGGEVSIEVKLDEHGIKAAAKSRTIAALDRLCGNLIDLPGGFVEGRARRQRVRNAIREAILVAQGREALERLGESGQFGSRALENNVEDILLGQGNKDAIAALAIEDLRENANTDEVTSEDVLIADDWMNLFSSHAENASSEHLQLMWGKVLAGEIRKPGSFSLSTLRFISELDRDIAEKFQDFIRDRFDRQFLVKPEKMEGQTLLDAAFLEEVGLLHQVTGIGGINITYNYGPDGSFSIRERNMILVMSGPPNTEVDVGVIKITRTGQEISAILPLYSPDTVLRSIAKKFYETATKIELAIVTHELPNGQIAYQPIDKLK